MLHGMSRLNEIGEGFVKILPASSSFWSNLKFFKTTLLTAWLCGSKVKVNGIISFSSFCDAYSFDCRLIVKNEHNCSHLFWYRSYNQRQRSIQMCTTNLQIPTVICCIHLHTHGKNSTPYSQLLKPRRLHSGDSNFSRKQATRTPCPGFTFV